MKIIYALIMAVLLASNLPGKAEATTQNFFEYEAGIAAYFQFTPPANLQSNLLRNQFRTITSNQADYLIGFVPEEGYEQFTQADIKVVVHNDGWVVAYFMAETPSSFIYHYTVGDVLKLDQTLGQIAEAMELAPPVVIYTHFKHPAARTMALIEVTATANTTKQIDFRLPVANTYFESSWYVAAPGMFCSLDYTLDDKFIRRVQNAINWDFIAAGDLVPASKHIAKLRGGLTQSFYGLAILYAGSADLEVNFADGIRYIDLPPVPDGLTAAGLDIATYHISFLPLIAR